MVSIIVTKFTYYFSDDVVSLPTDNATNIMNDSQEGIWNKVLEQLYQLLKGTWSGFSEWRFLLKWCIDYHTKGLDFKFQV